LFDYEHTKKHHGIHRKTVKHQFKTL
jgi:hypothetical protein